MKRHGYDSVTTEETFAGARHPTGISGPLADPRLVAAVASKTPEDGAKLDDTSEWVLGVAHGK